MEQKGTSISFSLWAIWLIIVPLVLLGFAPGVGEADEARGTVQGVVVDEEGNPVTGAQIRALRWIWRRPLDPFADAVDIVSGEAGRFEAKLLPGSHIVTVRKGLLSADEAPHSVRSWEVAADKALEDIRIPLKKGGRVTGLVVTKEDGTPLADAGVILELGAVTRTDSDGRFEFEGVGFGEHRLKVVCPGMADQHVDINTTGHDVYEVRIDMSPGYTVRGTVTDEQGQPVVGALVEDFYCGSIVHVYMQGTYTDEHGRYEISGYSAKRGLNIQAHHPDFASSPNLWSNRPMAADMPVFDITLNQGYVVHGQVLDAEGNWVKGAQVSLGFNSCNPNYTTTKTDQDGKFRLDRLAEDREDYVVVQANSYAPAYQRAKPGRGNSVPNLSFTLQPGAVAEGEVVDREGKPVAGAKLHAQMSVEGRCGSEYIGDRVTADEEGRFRIESLPSSGVSVDVLGGDYKSFSPVRRHPLSLHTDNIIVMDPPGVITGKVIDEQTSEPITVFNVKLGFPTTPREPGEPSASYSCHLSDRGQDCRSEEGLFTIEDLICRAPHAVIVSAEGYAPTRIDRVVARPRDAEEWPVEIKLDTGQTLSGSVVDADSGLPIADAEVTLLISPESRHFYFSIDMLEDPSRRGMSTKKAATDAAGWVEIKGVPTDQHLHVVVQHEQYALLIVKDVDPDEPISVKLVRGATIEGSMAGYPGVELKDAAVWLQGRGNGWDLGRRRGDPDGSYSFTNLPPGDYYVILVHQHRNRRTECVTLAQGQTLHIDFGNLPGVKLSGRLTCQAKPIAGANVELLSGVAFERPAHEITDKQGRYEIAGVPAGEYVLTANDRKGDEFGTTAPYSRTRKLITVGDTDCEANLTFHPGRIKGRVVDAATGEPFIENVTLHGYWLGAEATEPDLRVVCSTGESGEPRFYTTSASWYNPRALGMLATRRLGDPTTRNDELWAQCADDGSFEFVGVAPGQYVITAQGPDNSAPSFVTGITVGLYGASEPVELRLDASAGLRLKIVDAATKRPIAEADVHLCTPRGVYLSSQLRKRVDEEGAGCPIGGCCGPGGPRYTYDQIRSDTEGLVDLDRLRQGIYGVWVMAPGYCPCWVAPLIARPRLAGDLPTTITMQPAGTLVLRAAPGLLDGIHLPYVVYRICDSGGRVVFPGGEAQGYGVLETGVGSLGEDNPDGHRVDVLPPGRYTITWEIHRGPEPGERRAREAEPPTHRGKAEFQIREGKETVVVMSG